MWLEIILPPRHILSHLLRIVNFVHLENVLRVHYIEFLEGALFEHQSRSKCFLFRINFDCSSDNNPPRFSAERLKATVQISRYVA